MLLAILLPALFTGGSVLIVARPAVPGPARADSPERLATLADSGGRPLRPVAATPGAAALGAPPLESLDGGVRPAAPARIFIPAAGVDAVVDPVRSRRGALRVPAIGRAGWYADGARPGEAGRSVIIGHLDSGRGPGLFSRVPGLPPGTRVSVLDRRGAVHRYNVVGGAQVRKSSFPREHVYGHSESPVLVLVTCGGRFVRGRGYSDNVLVYARAA